MPVGMLKPSTMATAHSALNVPRGRIGPTYLIDAAGEAAFIAGWALVSRRAS